MKKIIVLIAMVLVIIIWFQKEEETTSKKEYLAYLENTTNRNLDQSKKALEFWGKRITKDSAQIIELGKVAVGYTGVFQSTAEITALKKAEQALTKAVSKAGIGKDSYLRALAQNYITQHRFKEAKEAVVKAEEFGGEKRETNFLKFDVAMELGDYEQAYAMLEKEADFSNYNYLIRRAKWEDYKGNLNSTIHYMEKAKAIAESGKQKGLMLWVYTNLADYYGHAGRIKDSYNHYLKALEVDPNNAYAKKGIAWITYAHQENPDEALRIIATIEKENKSPDYHLLKAEIYEYKGDLKKSKSLINTFIKEASNPLYGNMYNSYLLELYAGNSNTTQEAVTLGQQEVSNRATPETYDLLAYAHLKNGNPQKALEIQEKNVIGKTFEPVAQLHTAEIYKALDMNDKVTPLKNELLEAGFELGPVTTATVKNL